MPRKTGAQETHSANLTAAVNKLQETAKRKAAQRALEPVQLPMWDDDLRGMPNSFARGALFTAAKSDGKIKRDFYEGKQVATLAGINIEYRGQELRQDDYSVFLAILHFGRRYELGKPIPFTAYTMLKELGWSINTAEYKHLRECCSRLSATSVSVTQNASGEQLGGGYEGSLIRSFAWKDEKGKQLSQWVVLLEPSIAALFADPSFTLMSPAERKAIGGRSPLAQWLHSFLSTHREPYPISVTKYHELSASRSDNMNDFRRRLKVALTRLIEVGFLKEFAIKNDIVHVKRIPRHYRLPQGQNAAEPTTATLT
ncbi:plasmid replication initiator TrfA [Noviherbaspirillum pedocola]|uniref:Replication initiator protein A n=1 Tax=Noviherbaspirillum pedocola TaxID=2801341 RepID=A0A934W502_9BURK|nr:plasmid replication initiator TrfA [Noviherbaspirillum pedocola]MBK4739091.1 replication initiator protein A [Noviherbaspirillum pedocola]